ncbi:P-loop containing nucleoside triphosphate hydrolase protein [Dunaliella salina]|nr:P-loop containing nucleoside triphosphate hydrolase protein [Dunaliella salina]|eukprot:KAF5835639.1 P-loop containing nucleoside triphosphate hydrolase protein [Dunaliella salina]
MGEISQLLSRLSSIRRFSRGGHWVVPLHSSVSPADQRQAFKIPPKGVRKIVLATNIAETSLTIEDVVAVVDTGKHKERRYDPARRMSLLVTDWVSRASAKQRKGRAGRVRPGTCFCLYTKDRFETLMRPFGAPEIVRVPLEELVLQIHLMGLGTASSFLEKVLQPPPQKSVAAAVATLREVGAFPSEGPEVLTPLGHHLAQLPVDPRLGKLLVLGCVLGCLGPAASVAAAMSHKQPFVAPLDKRDDAEKARRSMAEKGSGNIASGQQSDHLLLVAAISGWLALGADTRKPQAQQVHLRGYLKKFFLHEQTLKELQEMREQFASMLEDARLVSPRRHTGMQLDLPPFQHWLDDKDAPWNRHARTPAVVKALLAASLVPNVASMSEASAPASPPMWLTPANRSGGGAGQGGGGQLEEVFIHPSSLCYNLNTNSMSQPFVVYLEKVKTSRTFLRDVTPVSPISLMLFGGPLTVLHQEGAVLVDGWIRVRAAAQTAVVVKALREALDRLLQEKVKNPSLDLSGPRAEVIPTIARLLQEDEHHHQHQL